MNELRVAILGNPAQPDVPWTAENVAWLADGGFNAVQLNIAWSYRPNDEPLNLEDVVEIGEHNPQQRERIEQRAGELRRRAALATAAGLRTILHVGVPFQGRNGYDGNRLPHCISDPAVVNRYRDALRRLAGQQPDLDDLLVYTYDQDAWLCSEFDACPRCTGVPLHLRVTAFLNQLAAEWREHRGGGRLWWEPWELSAGQTLAAIPLLDPETTGLMVHSTIAEVISTMAADAFLRTAARLAGGRGLPVVVEAFLACANEEVEPWTHLPVPLVTLQQVRRILQVPGVSGVKEYYGIAPDPFDVNTQAALALLRHPELSDEQLLARAARGYGAPWLAEFWRRTSMAYTLYPWDASWFARELGNSQPLHELTAAGVRGQQAGQPPWDTPAWRSSRHGAFMATTNAPQHPWFGEDVGLRCGLAADAMESALDWFDANLPPDDDLVRDALRRQRSEAEGFVTRARAYALHLRETLLSRLLRNRAPRRAETFAELRELLQIDLANQERELRRAAACGDPRPEPRPVQLQWRWVVPPRTDTEPIRAAITLLETDPEAFLDTYFLEVPDRAPIGQFSLTSR